MWQACEIESMFDVYMHLLGSAWFLIILEGVKIEEKMIFLGI